MHVSYFNVLICVPNIDVKRKPRFKTRIFLKIKFTERKKDLPFLYSH